MMADVVELEIGELTVGIDRHDGGGVLWNGRCRTAVRRVAPEIVDMVDTTNHAAGKKRFYQRTG